MLLAFEDGTSITLPNGPSTQSFIQFDLHWLVYIHGKVTKFDPQGRRGSAALPQIPEEVRHKDCFFC